MGKEERKLVDDKNLGFTEENKHKHNTITKTRSVGAITNDDRLNPSMAASLVSLLLFDA